MNSPWRVIFGGGMSGWCLSSSELKNAVDLLQSSLIIELSLVQIIC